MSKKEPSGCGCTSIPFSLILLFMGGGYWLYNSQYKDFVISQSISLFKETISLVKQIPIPAEVQKYIPQPASKTTITQMPPKATNSPNQPTKSTPVKSPVPTQKPSAQSSHSSLNKAWQNKAMRGIYISRYAITNNASEKSIRSQVRYLRSQGINTIIHGVWGNACTMSKYRTKN